MGLNFISRHFDISSFFAQMMAYTLSSEGKYLGKAWIGEKEFIVGKDPLKLGVF